MTPEGKRALWIFSRAAAVLVPMVAVPVLTFTFLNWRQKSSLDDDPAVWEAMATLSGKSNGE